MAELYVSPAKWAQLQAEMREVGIREEDLDEKFIRGSGRGGQKINKTSSCVYLKHVPTGLDVKCQASRSREVNRLLARRELCERVEALRSGECRRRTMEAERIRRQKRRRSRRQKQRLLAMKRRLSAKKELRKPVCLSEG